MTTIASPLRPSPFDNPTRRSTLKGGSTIDGLLFRSKAEIAKRYRALEDAAATAENDQRAASEKVDLARADLDTARRNHIFRQDSLAQFDINPDSAEAAELLGLEDAVARAKARLAAASAEASAATTALGQARETFNGVRRFVARKVQEQTLQPVAVAVEPSTDPHVAIADAEEALADKRAERERVKGALAPADSVERQLLRDLDTLAAQGEISISDIYGEQRRPKIEWPMRSIYAEPSRGGSGERPRVVDSEAMFARFFRDKLASEIRAAVAAEYADLEPGEALSASDKRQRLAQIDVEIAQIERELAELIWLAREDGEDVPFPVDLPAAAILGVVA